MCVACGVKAMISDREHASKSVVNCNSGDKVGVYVRVHDGATPHLCYGLAVLACPPLLL